MLYGTLSFSGFMKRLIILCIVALLVLAGCVEEKAEMSLSEAKAIAQKSDCMSIGNLTSESTYNNNTQTWWLDLDTVKPGCNPACVVYENKSASVNWRCTGLIPPDNETKMCNKPCHIYIGTTNYTENPISCIASTEPMICTMEYRSGDICLKFVQCELDSQCKTTVDPKFDECISCFEGALLKNLTTVKDCEDRFSE